MLKKKSYLRRYETLSFCNAEKKLHFIIQSCVLSSKVKVEEVKMKLLYFSKPCVVLFEHCSLQLAKGCLNMIGQSGTATRRHSPKTCCNQTFTVRSFPVAFAFSHYSVCAGIIEVAPNQIHLLCCCILVNNKHETWTVASPSAYPGFQIKVAWLPGIFRYLNYERLKLTVWCDSTLEWLA